MIQKLLIIIIVFLKLNCDMPSKIEKAEYERKSYSIDDSFIENEKNGIFEIIEPLWWSVNL